MTGQWSRPGGCSSKLFLAMTVIVEITEYALLSLAMIGIVEITRLISIVSNPIKVVVVVVVVFLQKIGQENS